MDVVRWRRPMRNFEMKSASLREVLVARARAHVCGVHARVRVYTRALAVVISMHLSTCAVVMFFIGRPSVDPGGRSCSTVPVQRVI